MHCSAARQRVVNLVTRAKRAQCLDDTLPTAPAEESVTSAQDVELDIANTT